MSHVKNQLEFDEIMDQVLEHLNSRIGSVRANWWRTAAEKHKPTYEALYHAAFGQHQNCMEEYGKVQIHLNEFGTYLYSCMSVDPIFATGVPNSCRCGNWLDHQPVGFFNPMEVERRGISDEPAPVDEEEEEEDEDVQKENIGKILNQAAHVAIGAWVGSGINDPRYRASCVMATVIFLVYQILQVWRKGDRGYDEVREFGIGSAFPMIWRRLRGDK